MHTQMGPQVLAAPESLATVAAHVGPVLGALAALVFGMNSQVALEAGAPLEGLATVGAQHHGQLLSFGLGLLSAGGLLVPSMRQQVLQEAGPPLEALATLSAQEGRLRVRLQVLVQM